MDGERFDSLIKRLGTTRLTRLTALRGLAAGARRLATGMSLFAEEAEAARKKRRSARICLCSTDGCHDQEGEEAREGHPAECSLRLQGHVHRALIPARRSRRVSERCRLHRRPGLRRQHLRGLYRNRAVQRQLCLPGRTLPGGVRRLQPGQPPGHMSARADLRQWGVSDPGSAQQGCKPRNNTQGTCAARSGL